MTAFVHTCVILCVGTRKKPKEITEVKRGSDVAAELRGVTE